MFRILRNLVLAVGCFAAAGLGQTGAVKSEGQPIPGATVRATQGPRALSTITDQDGAFHLDGMTPGAWTVEVRMFGFEVSRREVTVTDVPSKMDFTLQLQDRTRAFAGRGQAAAGAGVGAGEPGAEDSSAAVDIGGVSADSNAPPPGVAPDQSNESFLVNGTLSSGLQTQPGDLRPDFGPGGPGGLNAGGPGLNVPAGLGGATAGGAGAPGGAAGPGGGGPGGGPGGGGFGGGGGGFGGGRGGGGPGAGRGGGRGGPRPNGAFIGNRVRRGNRITGSIFYTLGDSALNARPFSVNGIQAPKAAYDSNRFGLTVGGPLVIPKLFSFEKVTWFVNYTGSLSRNGVDNAYTVPTLLQRNGDFSQTNSIIYVPPSLGNTQYPGNTPYPGNQIPIASLNSVALGLMNYIPLPNQPGVTNQNYRLITANPNNSEALNARLNTSLTQRDTLGFQFNMRQSDSKTNQVYGCCDSTSGLGINSSINYRHRFGARSFETLNLTFNRNTSTTTPFFASGSNVAANLGILGTSQNPLNYGPPNLSFTNYNGVSDATASRSAVESFGANDSYSVHIGKHNWSFGGGYTHYLNNLITDQNGRGTFNFSGLSTAGYDANGLPLTQTGYDFADFLLGLPEGSSVRYGDSSTYFRTNSYNAFAMDDYRVASNLTLNLGLRYEYFAPWQEKYGRIANLEIAPGFGAVAPVTPGETGPYGATYPAGLIKPDRNNFAPRIAVAWKPNPKGKLLIRAGYGWYYNPSQYNQFMQKLAAQPPFAVTNTVTTSSTDVLTLATGLCTPAACGGIAPVPGKTITNTYAVSLNYPDMYAQTWNFSLQRDLPGRLVAELAYLGTKGTHLDVPQAPNQAPLGSALTSEQRLPIANAGQFTFDDPVGNSIYQAGQFRLNRRFQRGVSAQLLYTYSKAIDDAVLAQNFYNQSAERALSTFDHRQVLTLNWVVASPVDATKGFLSHPAWVAKALKDWTISGGVTAQTGAPLTPLVSGNRAGTASIAPLRADVTGVPIDSGSGYFNPLAFTTPAPGQYGDAGRDTITGPGSFVMNLSLARSINVYSERRRLEFRIDANNVLNHVNPSGLVTTVNSTQYGLITSAGAMRSMTATVRFRF